MSKWFPNDRHDRLIVPQRRKRSGTRAMSTGITDVRPGDRAAGPGRRSVPEKTHHPPALVEDCRPHLVDAAGSLPPLMLDALPLGWRGEGSLSPQSARRRTTRPCSNGMPSGKGA